VEGHVVDYFRRPVPRVPVTIAELTVETNEAGEFRFESVSIPYDVALLTEQAGDYEHAWVYQGLTRTDPTLQVLFGSPYRSSGAFTIDTQLDLASTQKLGFAAAGRDGAWSYSIDSAAFVLSGFNWRGPTQADFTVHGLWWESSDAGLPISYLAQDAQPVLFRESSRADVTFDLALDAIVSASVAGSVTAGTDVERNNHAYLRFADQAQIRLFSAAATAASFEYAVPALAETSIVVAATEGRYASEYAIAHREVAAGGRNIQLEIPRPARLRAPESNVSGVGPGSVFEWDGDAAAYLLFIEDFSTRRRALRVLTSSKKVALPALRNFALTPGVEHYWRVETHGRGRNVDDLTGSEGFADAFCSPAGGSGGPRRTEGSFSISVARGFIAE
jgi:hypothetical protein